MKKKIIHIFKNIPFIFILYKKFLLKFLKYKYSKNKIKYFKLYIKNKKKFINETLPSLNGQKNRKKIISQILRSKTISKIYETGSFHGSSALFFSKFKIPVYTCEILKDAYLIAKDRLKKNKKTKIINCSSILFLKKLKKNNKQTFFYLDAHGPILKNPLLVELDFIFNKFSNFIIMIDDFWIPALVGNKNNALIVRTSAIGENDFDKLTEIEDQLMVSLSSSIKKSEYYSSISLAS